MSMSNDLYNIVDSMPEIVDTPDAVSYQLANLNYRADIIITIMLFVLLLGISGGICYIFYRFILRFI